MRRSAENKPPGLGNLRPSLQSAGHVDPFHSPSCTRTVATLVFYSAESPQRLPCGGPLMALALALGIILRAVRSDRASCGVLVRTPARRSFQFSLYTTSS